jgi:NADPH:quinone reductase-like Zn-dependent oxidoreductase
MKAIVRDEYGSPEVLFLENIEKPEPKATEVLVKVYATSASTADARIRAANFPEGFGFFAKLLFGLSKPRQRILGGSFSGVVEAVGSHVAKFKVSDEVLGMRGISQGTYAEYIVAAEHAPMIIKPESMSHEEAACMPFGATTALCYLRDEIKIQKGQTILMRLRCCGDKCSPAC